MMPPEAELRTLISRRNGIDERIRKAKAQLAREAGEAFDSIDEVACDEPGLVLSVHGRIPGSKHLHIYTSRNSLHAHPEAYDCPNCGVVKGSYLEYTQDRSEGHHVVKATTISCRICGTELGESSWKWDAGQLFRYTI